MKKPMVSQYDVTQDVKWKSRFVNLGSDFDQFRSVFDQFYIGFTSVFNWFSFGFASVSLGFSSVLHQFYISFISPLTNLDHP